MSQSRAMSLIEACTNTGIGLAVGLCGQLIVFPAVGLSVTWEQNGLILVAFTVIAIARSYCVRRLFNWWRK